MLYLIQLPLLLCILGNQRKNEMASRPLEPAEENTYQEGGNSAVPQEAEDSLGKEDPPES